MKIYRYLIFPPVLYGCENWSLALREEHRLEVFENRELRKNWALSGRKWQDIGENCVVRSFIIFHLRQILLGRPIQCRKFRSGM
jgi:hypothetical protein